MPSTRALLAAALVAACSQAARAAGSDGLDDFEDFDEMDFARSGNPEAPPKAYTFQVEHDLTDGFKPRNEITYTGSLDVYKRRLRNAAPTMKPAPFSFTGAEVMKLEELARSGGFYRVRVPTNVNGDAAGKDFVQAFIPACSVVASRFTEHLVFQLGDNGRISALDYITTHTDCSFLHKRKAKRKASKDIRVTSITRIEVGVDAHKPELPEGAPGMGGMPGGMPGGGMGNAPGGGAGGKEGGKEGDKNKKPVEEPSFFKKYWYVWPLVIMWMMNSPDQGGGGGGGAAKKK